MDNRSNDVIILKMNNKHIDENRIAEAKEKLACHIGPGESKRLQSDYIDDKGKVLLTQMTAAGG